MSVYVIAEAGVNHNGNENIAMQLIDIAVAAGADAVKFQLFNPKLLVTSSAAKAEYQSRNLKDEDVSQQDMLKTLTMEHAAYVRLERYCREKNIDFLCTPFDHESLAYLLANTQMRYVKLASGEVANAPLLLASARSGLPVILSTGMSNLAEIGEALSVLHFGYTNATGHPKDFKIDAEKLAFLRDKVTLLHCVSQYPAPVKAMNLHAIETMQRAFHLPVGFSDHSLGITLPIASAAMGAVMVEKHFTYDNKAAGPDHAASLMPDELKAMVASLRDVTVAMGTGEKTCQPEEMDTRDIARRGIVAARPIAMGEVFSEENLVCKRPAKGLEPKRFWELLGKKASADYACDDSIHETEL